MVVSFYFFTFMTRSSLKHFGVVPFDVNAISNFVILDFELLFSFFLSQFATKISI